MDVQTDIEAGSGIRDPRLRVLLVGTDRVACTLVLRLLERLGYPPPERCLTLSAVAWQPHRFDLVLVDDSGIAQEGDSAAAPGASDGTRVVFMGADGAAHGIRADTQLRKPLTLEALRSALAGSAPAPAGEDFDPAYWSELLGLFGRSGLAEMIAALERDLPQQGPALERAVRHGDAAALRGSAHTLRGVAQQLGAGRLASLCTEVETRAAGGMSAETAASAARMLSRYGALITRLRLELEKS